MKINKILKKLAISNLVFLLAIVCCLLSNNLTVYADSEKEVKYQYRTKGMHKETYQEPYEGTCSGSSTSPDCGGPWPGLIRCIPSPEPGIYWWDSKCTKYKDVTHDVWDANWSEWIDYTGACPKTPGDKLQVETRILVPIDIILDNGVENIEDYYVTNTQFILSDPEKDGYIFQGWQTTGDVTITDQIVTVGNTYSTITAKYVPRILTVKFTDFKGNIFKTEEVEYGNPATEPENHDVEGYDFIAWNPQDFSCITNHTVIQGVYSIKTYPVLITTNFSRSTLLEKTLEHFNTITYLDKDGNEISTTTIDGPYTNNIEPDELYGYTFKTYEVTDDGEGNYFIKPLYQAKKYKVTFFDSKEKLLDTQFVEYLCAAEPPSAPRIHGYTFAGWDKPYINIVEDTQLTALYNEDESVPRWSVTFSVEKGDTDYGYFNVNNEKKFAYTEPRVIDTTKLEDVLPTYTLNSKCKFNGWYVDGNKINPSTYKVTGITNVVVKFFSDVNFNNIDDDTEYVTVTFDTQGGSKIDPKTVTLNKRLDSLDSPTKEGYEFDGWYLSSSGYQAFDFKSNITQDMTLYAKWIDLSIEEDTSQPVERVISSEIVEDPSISVLIPDYQHLYCQIDFVNANNGDISDISVKYGTKFYIYNLKEQKIREYQARQNSMVDLPKITIQDNQNIKWVITWNNDDIAYHLIPILVTE